MASLYDYSSTEIELPPPVVAEMQALAGAIPDDDLVEPGRELRPHVTVLDGLETDDPAQVREALAGTMPFSLRLGLTGVFHAITQKTPREIVMVSVVSDVLREVRRRLAARLGAVPTVPRYVPHATLAFVRPGAGARYAGHPVLDGVEVRVDHVVFSTCRGERVRIPLPAGALDLAHLTEWRHAAGLSRAELARRARIPWTMLRRLEERRQPAPRAAAIRLAMVLGLPWTALADASAEPVPEHDGEAQAA